MYALTWVLLFVWLAGGVSVCMMENYTLLIEKRGCSQCIAINTTICSGFCHTQDTNVKGRVGKSYLIQRGCMPHSLVYHPARVPGCPLHVNNVLYYPESRRCHCTRCDGHAHRCVHMTQATPTPYRLDCCVQSPDLNHIQNVWRELKTADGPQTWEVFK
uniref:Glycoprotein hormone subunit beta domain-containing protein n=1 Tax=Oncorhynchus tshawytscha TaxID=74940 RepID=A0A8C8GNZ3_ONCTS